MKKPFLLFYNAMSTDEVMRCLIRVNILTTQKFIQLWISVH